MLAGALAAPLVQPELAKVYDRMRSDMIAYNVTLHDRLQYIDSVLAEYGVDSLDAELALAERKILNGISPDWNDEEIKDYLDGEIERMWEEYNQ